MVRAGRIPLGQCCSALQTWYVWTPLVAACKAASKWTARNLVLDPSLIYCGWVGIWPIKNVQ